MGIIIVFVITAAVLLAIFILSSREEKEIEEKHAPHGKLEEYYPGIRDRRKSQRFDVELDVKYNLLKRSAPRFSTNSKNISEVGVAILIYEMLPKGSIIEMEIGIPDSTETLKIKGEVIWCEDRKGPERYDKDGKRTFVAGIKFLEVDARQKELLLGYMNKRLSKSE